MPDEDAQDLRIEAIIGDDEDLAAHVQWTSDGKEFILALAELEATDRKCQNRQLRNDHAVRPHQNGMHELME